MEPVADRAETLEPTRFADFFPHQNELAAAEGEKIQQVYREIERRDGNALWWARSWFRFACVLTIALLVALGVIAYLAVQASRVQAFVQPVQITEEGKMVLVGVPKDLLDFEPEKAHWHDMLSQWVIKRRWKGDEDGMKRTRNDWAWLYHHTCGAESKILAAAEQHEQPFKPSKMLTSVEILVITKTATPESFQVEWQERQVNKVLSSYKDQRYLGTFTVGRLRPKDAQAALANRLGLCVTGADIATKEGA